MSDTSPPPKPKPGSLRDRIAAFEQKPTTPTSGPPIAPRPKPGNLSQWKPRPSSPHDAQPATDRNDSSMSANDAKQSITKGGSLKERMAALQGLGAFGGGAPAAPPPRPAEKPKWKPPPQVAVAPPMAGDEDEGDSTAADNKLSVSPLKTPSDDILASLSGAQPSPAQEPAQEGASEIEGAVPAGEEDAPDPEEEERQRRAAIAARMARLGGARVGMAPPIFGRKPEVKPKPATDVRVAEPQPRSEGDVEQARAETGVAANVPLSTSPPTDETAAETPSPQPRVSPSENVPQHPPASESPNIPSRSMPIPQAPRRAAPPRKKSSQKQTPPTETEATTLSPEKDTPIPDVSDAISESPTVPISVPGHVESEVNVAADPTSNLYSAESADENLQPTEQTFGIASQLVLSHEAGSAPTLPSVPPPPPLVPHTESRDEPEVESGPAQDLQSPDYVGEQALSSIPTVPQTTQEEFEAERASTSEPGTDEALFGPTEEDGEECEDESARRRARIAERVAKMGGFNPFGEQPMRSPSLGDEPPPVVEHKLSGGEVPVESEGTTTQDHSAAQVMPPIPHSAFQQGESATGVNDDGDDGDGYDVRFIESDPHAQVPLQHAVGDQSSGEGANDYNDAFTRVAHEAEVKTFTQTAEFEEHPEIHGGVSDAAAPSPRSTIHGQYATDDFGAAQMHTEGEPLAPALSTTDDTSDNEMAPPRVTRPLPPPPVIPSPDVSMAPAAIVAPVLPPPPVPKRTSLPPPARAVPVSAALDSPPLTQSSSPQRVPAPKRASLLPASREIPLPAPDSPDPALQRRQPSTKRTSLPPPTRAVPSPFIPQEGSVIIPPPPPPPPPSFGYAEQEPWEPVETKEAHQGRDELIAPPPPVLPPSRKPSIRPPTPDGRRSMESRRSTDSRPSHEERRGPGQHAMATTIGVTGPVSPPSRKRAPSSLLPEKEVLDDNVGDPIDPRFYTPSRSPIPFSPSPATGTDSISSASPATTSPAPPASESGGNEELKRRKTIAERMAKLGGIKFGAPPPPPPPPPSVNRVQSPTPAQPAEDEDAEGSTAVPAQPAPEEEEEEGEQARRQRITAKLAGMGGMRFGMLPIQPGMGVGAIPQPPPPPIPTRPEEEATPRSPPRDIASSCYPESDQEYEHPSSSDDGVQVEAEESELEEVRHEDLEDEYGVEAIEEERLGTPPPPPPPRSTRPPIPTGRPPPIPPIGRRPSLEATLASGRIASFETITSTPRPPVRLGTSDFVMVEAEEVQIAQLSHFLEPSDLAATGQCEQPSISSGSLDLHNSGDLSASRWSEDSTTYPPAAPSLAPHPPPVPGQPRAAPVGVSARVTADELRAVWDRVGTHVAEAASRLFERSKHTLVGTGSYEGLIAEALAQVPNAAPPHRPGEYGFLIYAQTGAKVHTRLTDIMPGDVVVLEGAKLKGHKGLQSYSQSVGGASPCMGVVREFDAKKLKLKALQANQRVGQATVESVSYRLEDLKSGTIKVYRVQEA